MAEHCETNGVTWKLEARADSWMWEQVAIKRIEAIPGVERVELHGCAFGGPQPVHLAFIGKLAGLTRDLLWKCEADGHQHHPGPPGSELAYPVELAATLGRLILDSMRERGLGDWTEASRSTEPRDVAPNKGATSRTWNPITGE